jgi:Rieske Fe-S protein
MTTDHISRRTLGGLAAAGVGVPLLAACGGDDSGTASDPAGASSSATPSAATSSAGPSETASSSAASGGGDALTTTADIEVGGGSIFADEEVVVTQPSKGEFKCFTAICTHQGCVVSSVSDGTINCECHGSRFSIENGDVEAGPATFALEEIPIDVAGEQISLA